jgi:hypothetical protein
MANRIETMEKMEATNNGTKARRKKSSFVLYFRPLVLSLRFAVSSLCLLFVPRPSFFLPSSLFPLPSCISFPLPSIFSLLLLSSLLPFPMSEAMGAEFKLIPSLGLQEEYNDNIFYTDKNRVDDFITTVTPGLELVNRTEKVDVSLLARMGVLWYADNHDLNNIDQNYQGKVRYSPVPTWTLSGEAGYVEDSRPDRDLEVTGLVNRAAIRYRQNYGAGVDHIFSEKTKVGLTYAYSRDDYSEPNLADLKAHDATLSLIHDLSRYLPNIAGRMNFGYSRYEYEFANIDYYYATMGISWALSEKWNLLLDGGGSYTLSEFGSGGNEIKDRGTGWFGMGSLSYKGEKTTGDLTFSHRIAPAYGTVGVSNRTSLSVGMNRRFTYEFSGGLSAGYFINKAEAGKFSTVAFDEETFYVNPRVRYEFTKDIALEGSYHYSFTNYREANTEARRSLVMIRLYLQHALFE